MANGDVAEGKGKEAWHEVWKEEAPSAEEPCMVWNERATLPHFLRSYSADPVAAEKKLVM